VLLRQFLSLLATNIYQLSERIIMNKDQAKGAVKNILGQAQEQAGAMVGNHEQQAKGLARQVSGRAQEALGDAKEVVKHVREVTNEKFRKV